MAETTSDIHDTLIQFNKSSLGLAEVCLIHEILQEKKSDFFFFLKRKLCFLKVLYLVKRG